VFNHVKLIIEYHQVDPEVEGHRVVGFYVEPISVKHHFTADSAGAEWTWDGKAEEGKIRPLTTCSKSEWLSAEQVAELQVVEEGERGEDFAFCFFPQRY